MDDSGLVRRWQEAWDRPVAGWDFSRFGDRLSGDAPPWSYVDLAREALSARGIDVVAYDAERGEAMPFPHARFDLVLDRHEAYDAGEVARVLRPGWSRTWPRHGPGSCGSPMSTPLSDISRWRPPWGSP